MYNEDLKRSFIYSYSNSVHTRNICTTLFNRLEKYEEFYESDICTFTSDIVQPVVEEICGVRTRSKWQKIAILKSYARWCIEHNVTNATDALIYIKVKGIDNIRSKTVSSPAHLQKYLDEICFPVEYNTIDNIYRCLLWLAYSGMYEEDALTVTDDEVDFNEMIISHNGIEYPIYREAVPVFRSCVENKELTYIHPNYSKQINRERYPGNILVRGYVKPNFRNFRTVLSRMTLKKQDLRLSYFRAWLSGIFYMVYEEDQMGVDPYEFFRHIVAQKNKVYKLDKSRNTQEFKQAQLVIDYIDDYSNWKQAYKTI